MITNLGVKGNIDTSAQLMICLPNSLQRSRYQYRLGVVVLHKSKGLWQEVVGKYNGLENEK